MYILFSTGCLYNYPLPEVFALAKEAGFNGIELLIDRHKSNLEAGYIQKLSDEYEMPVLSVHSPFMVCDGWGDFWDRIWKSLNLAKELSARLVNFHPPDGFIFRHRLNRRLSEYVVEYTKFVKDSGIILTMENLPSLWHLRNPVIRRLFPILKNNTNQIVEFAEKNGIYVTFDTTHLGTMGMDLLKAYETFKDRVVNIHLSDYDGMYQHLLPGTGYLPLKAFLVNIRHYGYDGFITLESHPDSMGSPDNEKVIRNAKIALEYIKAGK